MKKSVKGMQRTVFGFHVIAKQEVTEKILTCSIEPGICQNCL